MNTKLIHKYSQSHLAYIHKGLLEEQGIKTYLFGNNFMSTVPNLTGILNAGIEFRVNEIDYGKSLNILEMSHSETETCANCNSENLTFSYGKRNFGQIVFSVFSALIGEPFGNIKREYYCTDCNFKTKI